MSGENRVDTLNILTNIRLEKNSRLGEYVPKLIEPELITVKNK